MSFISCFRHHTLGVSVNIIVVRIIVLKHERAGPIVSNRAQETLQKFCQWQQMYNDKNDDSPNHHDVAILLTRYFTIHRPEFECGEIKF